MIIDIFGDSFSDDTIRHQSTDTWTDLLKNEYGFQINNYSRHGTGAQWCVEEFMKLEDYGDFLLFCFPDMNRISFEYFDEHEQAHALLLYNYSKYNDGFDFPETINEKIIEMSDRIFDDFEAFYSTGLYRILEVLFVSFILSKSKLYKKILIWPSSGLGFPFRYYSNKIEIPENSHIMSKSMHLIAQLENKKELSKKGNTFTFGKDPRNNHLSYENHIVFAKQVSDFFNNDIIPDYSKFKVLCGL